MAQSYLSKILEHKRQEVEQLKQTKPFQTLRNEAESLSYQRRPFIQAIRDRVDTQSAAVIAEVKKASPSKGLIRPEFDPKQIAMAYEEAGAVCLSVLTDEHFFQGCMKNLHLARAATSLPVLRKDFILDEYQIFESRLNQADCILLIVAALDKSLLRDYYQIAQALELDVLLEVHTEKELDIALELEPGLVGVNNRDLTSFNTSLETSTRLKRLCPKEVILVSESGIHSNEDIQKLQAEGIYAYLIGEAFMRYEDIALGFKTIIG